MKTNVEKIISGGQSGVDRAALDFALENGFAVGGWIPKGRLADDGRISGKYPDLKETASGDYAIRTELNVCEADATLIISRGKLGGGSRLTREFAELHDKKFLHIDFETFGSGSAVICARQFLNSTDCSVLNVAGPRTSEDELIYRQTTEFLIKLFD